MIRSFPLLLFLCSFSLYPQSIVFEEDFSNNEKEWRLINSNIDQSSIINGALSWRHNAVSVSPIYQYINQLEDRDDFTVSVKIRPLKLGSEYGLFWGGTNKNNANYILLKGKRYKYLQILDSRPVASTDYKANLNIRLDENQITLVKKGNKLTLKVNGNKVFEETTRVLMGKAYGVVTAGNTEVSVDDFIVKGTKLRINLAPDINYAEPAINLGPAINSTAEELTPVITANGKGIYFSRRYSPDNVGGSSDHQDIYYSEIFEGKWSPAVNKGKPLNNHGANAVCAVTPDGNKLLLMNTYDSQGKQKGAGLSISQKTESGWSVPMDVKIKNYYNRSEFNEFMLSNDGKVMILAVDRDDTHGGRDLYVSRFEGNGFWSAPKNMGPMINTPGIELSPFLASDGVSLYFSSTGHPGYGKNDIFVSKRLDDSWTKWSTPINMGKPLNSMGWDAYYSVPADGEYAYFVSSDNSIGLQDIFKIKLPVAVQPEPVVLIKGYVLNSKTNEPIATGIEYNNLATEEQLGIAQSDPKTGYYEITLPLSKAYSFFAEKKGFYSVTDHIDLKKSAQFIEIERNLYLTPIEIGQTMALNNVFFYRGKPTLMRESFGELNRLVTMLQDNDNIEIMLEGHTDNQGSAPLNVTLSEDRVKAVKGYLVGKGIDERRISGKGWGGEKPIADNSTENTRKLNRRVEFKIIKY